MEVSLLKWTRTVFTTTGSVLAGNTGALVGTVAGSLLAGVLPFGSGIVAAVLAKLATDSVASSAAAAANKLAPERHAISDDLQASFRDGLREALYDVGGPECFPHEWRSRQNVPREIVLPWVPSLAQLWRTGDPMSAQACDALHTLVAEVDAGRLPPANAAAEGAGVRDYLSAPTPADLSDVFYTQLIEPHVSALEFPEVKAHLRRHLLDRTLVHVGALLKRRPAAWCDFNRTVLEELRNQIRDVAGVQADLVDRLDALLDPQNSSAIVSWSAGLADLLAAEGQIEKKLDEGFEALVTRVTDQHREVVNRLDGLLVVTVRIEHMVGRVLRILENGQYVIEGKAAVPTDLPPEPGEPPYKGLQYFDERDADLFFGRELLTARLAGYLRERSFLAVVVGASGSGKSSVVRAGLIPALRRGAPLADGTLPPAGSAAWPVHVLTPTSHPLEALAATLTRDSESASAAATMVADLRADPRHLARHVRRILAVQQGRPADHLLFVVDQFEELFSLCDDPDERRCFVDCLLDAAGYAGAEEGAGPAGLRRPGGPAVVVITLRADFYHHCAEYANLRLALEQSQSYIGPMDQDELRRAIEEPARLGGWQFERGLVDLMLRDAGNEPGALPLLSHALLETWTRRRGRVMTLESYAEAGGVRRAIAKTADAVYLGLAPDAQVIARNIFLRLTELGEGAQDTRRRVELSELSSTAEQSQALAGVLDVLADARLVTLDKDLTTGSETVEVAHEALIREWPRLRGWLSENRAGLRVHRKLTEAALAWQKLGRETGSLYRGARLAEAGEYAESNGDALNPLEREFLAASQVAVAAEAAEREALRQRELEAAQRLAEEQQHRAEAEARRAAEQARAASQLRRRAVLLASAFALALVFLAAALLAARAAQEQTALANDRRVAAVGAQATAEAERGRANEQRDIAVTARAEADKEQHRAATEAHLALARELSAAALNDLSTDPERSILLALHAYSESQAISSEMLPEVEDALQRSVQTSRAVLRLPTYPGRVFEVAYSPDGKRLLTTASDAARIWDVSNGKLLLTLRGHSDIVWTGVFSPDGKTVATAGGTVVVVWDSESGRPLYRLPHPPEPKSVVFMPDGKSLVTGSLDGKVRIWDLETQKVTLEMSEDAPLAVVAVDREGKRIAAGDDRGSIRIWDAATGKLLVQWLASSSPIAALAFSKDGAHLLTTNNAFAQIWDLTPADKPALYTYFPEDTTVFGAAFSPDEAFVAVATQGGKVRVWRVAPYSYLNGPALALLGHTLAVEGVAFSPDGAHIATGSYDQTARIWDASEMFGATASAIRYLADGRVLQTDYDGRALALDPATGKTSILLNRGAAFGDLAISRDGKTWGIIDNNALQLVIFGQDLRQPRQTIKVAGPLQHLRLYAAGDRVLANDLPGNNAYVWDVATGKQLFTLSGHTAWIYDSAISPDGKLLATGSNDSTVRTWDAGTGAAVRVFLAPDSMSVKAVAFSPDSRWLAAGGDQGTVIVWDAATGEIRNRFLAHTQQIRTLQFSPDGSLLATTSDDRRMRLWDATSPDFRLLRTFAQSSEIWSADFSPDGSRLVTLVNGSPRGAVYLLGRDQLLARAQARLTRSLSADECRAYLHLDACPPLPGLPPAPQPLQDAVDPLPYAPDPAQPYCGGWWEQVVANVRWDCQDGADTVDLTGQYAMALQLAGKHFGDMVLDVDATYTAGPVDTGYGVIVRAADFSRGYYFGVSANGEYFLAKMAGPRSLTMLVPWTVSPAIRTGPATNHLRFVAAGSVLVVYANGVELTRFADKSFSSGDIGLRADTTGKAGLAVRFENVKVSPVDQGLGDLRPSAGLKPGDTLLADDFSGKGPRWIQDSGEIGRRYVADGQYHVENVADGRVLGASAGLQLSDFVMQLDVSFEDGPSDNLYGLMLRMVGDDNQYRFEINSQGSYSLLKRLNGQRIELIPWTKSDAIKPGKATNTLKVVADGDSLTLFVNGQQLATLHDDALAMGDVGFYAAKFGSGPALHVSFDNLLITALP